MKQQPLGELEVQVLRYVAEHAPLTVRETAERFGEPRGLARTTILTVMERLRKKGFLTRRREETVFRYSAAAASTHLLRDLVADFVHRTLGGSVSPFVAYLAESRSLTGDEVAELRRLVDELESEERKP